MPEYSTVFRIDSHNVCKESAIDVLRLLLKEDLVIHVRAHVLDHWIVSILEKHSDHFLIGAEAY